MVTYDRNRKLALTEEGEKILLEKFKDPLYVDAKAGEMGVGKSTLCNGIILSSADVRRWNHARSMLFVAKQQARGS